MERQKADRRQHARAQIQMEAVLEGSHPKEDVHLTVLNFSVGGFFCRVSREIPPLTRLGITFQFPPYAEHPPRRIETSAVVVRSLNPERGQKDYRMAAAFLALAEEDKGHIQGYVDWYRLIYDGAEPAVRPGGNA